MTSHDWFVDHRSDFAARILDPDEERRFNQHLAQCPECRVAVDEFGRSFAWLPMATGPAKPRPGFCWTTTKTILRPHPARDGRWTLPIAAIALLSVIGLGFGLRQSMERERHLKATLDKTDKFLAAARDTLVVWRKPGKVLHADIAIGGHRGGLLIFADSGSHRWNVVLHGLPPAPKGEKYQFWFICNKGKVRSVELAPAGAGFGFVTLSMPDRGGGVLGAALSIEPMAGSDDTLRGKELAYIKM